MFGLNQLDYQLQNVIYLGFCFMVLFSADFTVINMQKTLISSIHDENPEFTVDGYISLGITYAIFALSLWFGPSMVSIFGPRIGLSISAVCYTLYILAFNVEETWAIYAVTVLGGVAGGLLWTAEGNYIVCNSNSETISRNIGIFWAFFQSSSLIGNLYTFFKFEGKKRIDGPTRRNVIYVLGTLAGISAVMFLFLRPVRKQQMGPESLRNTDDGPWTALKRTGSLFLSKKMLILNITFIYTGLQHAFIFSVYSPSIGFTEYFGNRSKQLVALSGIFISLGGVAGGGVQTIFSKFLNKIKNKRIFIVIVGFFLEVIAYLMIYINLPNNAVFQETKDISFIEPRADIAMLCSFLLGIGDSCFNTQNFSIIAIIYPFESAQSSALYKFIKSFFVAVGLFYSTQFGLHTQVTILLPLAFIGICAFIFVDKQYITKKKSILELNSVKEINLS